MQQQPSAQHLGIELAALSDIGLRRTSNQDSYVTAPAASEENWAAQGHLFLVADGMGAHAAGELASKLAADAVPLTYFKHRELAVPQAIQRAVEEANQLIHSRGEANAEFRGMGTTASVLLLLPQGALVAHVGDSRVYRLRGNQLEQLTFDHSLVWEMTASGQVPAGQVPDYIPKNIITRSLGPNAYVEVDLEGPFPVEIGDAYLLCSDGLSGQVKDDEMGAIMAVLPPQDAAQALVDLANLRGGPDNITLIIARVTDARLATQTVQPWLVEDHASGRKGGVSAWVWGALLVFVAATVGLAALGLPAPAIGTAVAAAATGIVGLWQALSGRAPREVPTERFGSGPHRSLDCTPNGALAERLAKVVAQLSEAAIDDQWQIDWQGFNAHRERAEAAVTGKRFADAIAEYARAISFMMSQLREHRRTLGSG